MNLRQIRISRILLPVACLLLGPLGETVWGQSGSLFGNRGPLSQSGGGRSSTGIGGSGRGGGQMGGQLGSGGSLTGGGLSSGLGSGLGTGMGLGGQGGLGGGMTGPGGGFVGRGGFTPFAPNAQGGGAAGMGMGGNMMMGAGGAPFMQRGMGAGQFNRPNNLNGNFNQNAMGQGGALGAQRTPIRPRLQVGFEYQPPPPQATAVEIGFRLNTLARERIKIEGIQVTVEQGIVTLRGDARNVHDRKLAESMARLEPGVLDVRNEITVNRQDPTLLDEVSE